MQSIQLIPVALRAGKPFIPTAHRVSLAGVLLLFAAQIFAAQIANAQTLEDICFGDIELTEYTASVVAGESAANEDYYSASEQAEIATVLADTSLSGASAADHVRAVLQACTDGRILQARTSAALN